MDHGFKWRSSLRSSKIEVRLKETNSVYIIKNNRKHNLQKNTMVYYEHFFFIWVSLLVGRKRMSHICSPTNEHLVPNSFLLLFFFDGFLKFFNSFQPSLLIFKFLFFFRDPQNFSHHVIHFLIFRPFPCVWWAFFQISLV